MEEKIKEFYYKTRREIIQMFTDKNYFFYKYYDLKQATHNFYYWFKVIGRTNYWDSSYLLNIEEHYLKKSLKYFIKSDLVVNNEFIVRDIKICLSLIEIIKNEGENVKYVNIKNYKRFTPNLNEQHFSDKMIDVTKKAIAWQKAIQLYNKIRGDKMLTWWD